MSLEIQSVDGGFALDETTETISLFDDDFGEGLPTAPDEVTAMNAIYWNGWSDAVITASGNWAGSGGHSTGVFKNVKPDFAMGEYGPIMLDYLAVVGDRGDTPTTYDLTSLPDNQHSFRVAYSGGLPNPRLKISASVTGDDIWRLYLTGRKQVAWGGQPLWTRMARPLVGGGFETQEVTFDYSSLSGGVFYFYVCIAGFRPFDSEESYIAEPQLTFEVF